MPAADTSHLIGRRFGELIVIATSEFRKNKHSYVLVRCDCGQERPARVAALTRDNIKTCGGPRHVAIAREDVTYTAKEVAALVRAEKKAAIASVRTRRHPTRNSKTYAALAMGAGLVKIGRAFSVEERLWDLQMASALPLVCIAISNDDIERELHKALRAHRTHGEWFRHCDEVELVLRERMEPANINAMDIINERETPLGRKNRCHFCGELGHYAKTCVRSKSPV